MGMYTKLHCNIKIKKNKHCIKILEYMLDNNNIDNIEELHLDNHDLFKTSRWEYTLQCSSFYFTGTNNTSLKENDYNYVLHCDCDLKNYSNEIDLFLDWISQYCDYENEKCFIGYKIYEEDEKPTLLFFENNKLEKVED